MHFNLILWLNITLPFIYIKKGIVIFTVHLRKSFKKVNFRSNKIVGLYVFWRMSVKHYLNIGIILFFYLQYKPTILNHLYTTYTVSSVNLTGYWYKSLFSWILKQTNNTFCWRYSDYHRYKVYTSIITLYNKHRYFRFKQEL